MDFDPAWLNWWPHVATLPLLSHALDLPLEAQLEHTFQSVGLFHGFRGPLGFVALAAQVWRGSLGLDRSKNWRDLIGSCPSDVWPDPGWTRLSS